MGKPCESIRKSPIKKKEDDAMSISRDEFNYAIDRLHEKIDGIKTTVTQIETILNVTPIPRQPCKYLNEHIGEHKEHRATWAKAFIGAVASSVISAIVAAFTTAWVFLRKM